MNMSFRDYAILVICGFLQWTSSADAASGLAIATIAATDKKSLCTLTVPQKYATTPITSDPTPPAKVWGSPMMSWSGPCVGKKANGNGVARMLSGGKVIGTWYGDTKNGILDSGVIEDGYGYEAVRFVGGKPVLASDNADEAKMIARAKIAVKNLIKSFEKSGNRASAAFYRDRQQALESMALGE
jgi:hypothetical protein